MFGQGLFHGQLVAGNFVPSQQTDFIFTVAGEELGFVGTIVIVALLAVVICARCASPPGPTTCSACWSRPGSRCGSRSSRS